MSRRASLALLAALACAGDGPSAPRGEAVFVVRTCRGSEHAPAGETFRILLRDPATIAEAQAIVGAGNVRIVSGPLAAGDGGFNAPWSWHLDPAGVELVEGAIEACDGCPSFVEADLDYWLGVLGRFCPVTAELLRRER